MAGRTRSEESRRAILEAALALARARGYGDLTVDALAAHAGVGKQTIYRWWPSLGDVVLEALREEARVAIPAPETGSLEGDLAAFLTATFRLARGPESTAPLLKGLMAEAQLDARFAPRFAALIEERRAALRAIVLRHAEGARRDVEATVDMIFGAMWYRLLVGHGPLDGGFARTLARLAARQVEGG